MSSNHLLDYCLSKIKAKVIIIPLLSHIIFLCGDDDDGSHNYDR